jgi:hypothetical protein
MDAGDIHFTNGDTDQTLITVKDGKASVEFSFVNIPNGDGVIIRETDPKRKIVPTNDTAPMSWNLYYGTIVPKPKLTSVAWSKETRKLADDLLNNKRPPLRVGKKVPISFEAAEPGTRSTIILYAQTDVDLSLEFPNGSHEEYAFEFKDGKAETYFIPRETGLNAFIGAVARDGIRKNVDVADGNRYDGWGMDFGAAVPVIPGEFELEFNGGTLAYAQANQNNLKRNEVVRLIVNAEPAIPSRGYVTFNALEGANIQFGNGNPSAQKVNIVNGKAETTFIVNGPSRDLSLEAVGYSTI